MIVNVKRFETYVSSRNLGLSLKKVHYSPGKLIFLQETIMSSRKCLSCPREQPCAQGSKGLSCMGSNHVHQRINVKILFGHNFCI